MTYQASLVTQKKPLHADSFPEPDIVGRIVGIDEDLLFIRTATEVISLPFSSILNVEERTVEKWYK